MDVSGEQCFERFGRPLIYCMKYKENPEELAPPKANMDKRARSSNLDRSMLVCRKPVPFHIQVIISSS
jgi:hypothetical protein